MRPRRLLDSTSPRSAPQQTDAGHNDRRVIREHADGPSTPPAADAPSRTPSPGPEQATPGQGAGQGHPTPGGPAEPHAGVYTDGSLPGDPRMLPGIQPCIIPRSEEIAAEEMHLRWALTARVASAAVFSPGEAKAATLQALGFSTEDCSVRAFAPESFLFLFTSQGVPISATRLIFNQWTRLATANPGTLYFRVNLELEGIPPHAWYFSSAYQLLSPCSWIEKVDPRTESKDDMPVFRLTLWTDDPRRIPTEKELVVAEPEPEITYTISSMQSIFGNLPPYLMRKNVLCYNTIIHIRSIADFSPHSSSSSGGPSPPSSDGDSGPDGNPDKYYGAGGGGGRPRIYEFPVQSGVIDGPAPLPSGHQTTSRRHRRRGGGGATGDVGRKTTTKIQTKKWKPKQKQPAQQQTA